MGSIDGFNESICHVKKDSGCGKSEEPLASNFVAYNVDVMIRLKPILQTILARCVIVHLTFFWKSEPMSLMRTVFTCCNISKSFHSDRHSGPCKLANGKRMPLYRSLHENTDGDGYLNIN